jgi:hypothetical protein
MALAVQHSVTQKGCTETAFVSPLNWGVLYNPVQLVISFQCLRQRLIIQIYQGLAFTLLSSQPLSRICTKQNLLNHPICKLQETLAAQLIIRRNNVVDKPSQNMLSKGLFAVAIRMYLWVPSVRGSTWKQTSIVNKAHTRPYKFMQGLMIVSSGKYWTFHQMD